VSLTPSSEAEIGQSAPSFSLPDPRTGSAVELSSYQGQPVMVVFMCNHCPYVVHLLDGLVKAANQLADQGIATIAISSNSIVSHPQDGPDLMAALATEKNFSFPYLYDESQEVAKAYGAVCTPDFYLYDAGHSLYYRGQFDDSRPGSNESVTGESLLKAATAMLNGDSAATNVKPSVGCSIKWKSA